MTPSGSWDVSLLISLFPTSVVHHILSIRCPDTSDRVDFCRWCWNSHFTVRSAYMKTNHVIIWARHYYFATSKLQRLSSSLPVASPCQWSPPPLPWICLNADGAAIHDGLIVAWELGFEFVQVQSHCAKAISTLSVDNASRDSCALRRVEKRRESCGHQPWKAGFTREEEKDMGNATARINLYYFSTLHTSELAYGSATLSPIKASISRDKNGAHPLTPPQISFLRTFQRLMPTLHQSDEGSGSLQRIRNLKVT
ncbi:hypothetical protein V6N12_007534 [Hibiscus sabdariffa]|uniref:RNase H type-1 domain-containing protein n=1 Tax=Hibiscus sabdariffa TaxID=183260 RepID=A0ABR2F225_9ROSI